MYYANDSNYYDKLLPQRTRVYKTPDTTTYRIQLRMMFRDVVDRVFSNVEYYVDFRNLSAHGRRVKYAKTNS